MTMIGMFRCRHCGDTVPRNPRLKGKQQYCSARECQKARRRQWKRGQYTKDKAYRKKSKERQKIWRKKYPSDQYQKQYRQSHPEYVVRNRELQKARNKKRTTAPVTMIVKTDALVLQPRGNGVYLLSKVKKNMIVNRNALSLQPSTGLSYALLKVKKQKIVNRNALPLAGADI